ncbi:MAG TPA: hypothetical protein VFZ48_05915, partial [Candidatus Saccharimonadales bacterium]
MNSADVFSWMHKNWLIALVILAIVWLAQHFGGKIIAKVVRKVVRSTPLHKLTPDDIRKRQDTLI